MKSNTARTIVISLCIALSLPLSAPAFADSNYPPTENQSFQNPIIISETGAVETSLVIEKGGVTSATAVVGSSIEISLPNLKKGSPVSFTIVGPDGTKDTPPSLVVGSDGTLRTGGLIFNVKGLWVLTIKKAGGAIWIVNVTVFPKEKAVPIVAATMETLAEPKKKIVNQIVPITQSVKVNLPKDTTKTQVYVNGKLTLVKASKHGKFVLPYTVKPADKVTLVVTNSKGQKVTTSIPLNQNPISIANVNFDLGKFDLTSKATGILDNVVQQVKSHGITKIILTGYTDAQGEGKFDNLKLSKQRANAVQDYLNIAFKKIKYAITFSTDFKGPKDPIGSNKDSNGQVLNRRVEISVK
jgi:outer membrane protein OmpA-like peptidoglycan-associated protein